MSAPNLTQLRAIARSASSFESGVEKLFAAGLKNRARAIRLVQQENGRVYNEWAGKQHASAQRFTRAGGQTL